MSCPFWTRGGWMRRRVFDNPAKRAWWQVHVDAQRESGLTASKYCRQHRLLTRTFQIWRRELTDREEEKIQRKLKRRKRRQPISPDRRRQERPAFWASHGRERAGRESVGR